MLYWLFDSRFLTRLLLDIHADNLLIAITDESVLSDVEEQEINEPSARKQAGDRAIYVSRYMLGGAGPLTICDLGQARIGTSHRGTAMPLQYRAPEVILDMDWGQSVDMWSVGLLVRMSYCPQLAFFSQA